MTLVVIIVAAILSVIVIEITLGSLTRLNTSDVSLRGSEAEYYANGCLQEALIHLDRDNAYAGGSLNLGSGTCNATISGEGNDRRVAVSGSLNGYESDLSVEVVLSPFAIVKWDNGSL